jgi:carbon-monoxide dehydrogenase medium subunit
MKPPIFKYSTPTTIDEVLSLLRDHAPDARLLAGGQSLMPLLSFRLSRPDILIDINGVNDLSYIRDQGDCLAIGAMTREAAIEDSNLVHTHAPLLYEATKLIAHRTIRNRGTIGGSLANADPAAEYPAVMLALDCEMVIRSAGAERRVRADDFFEGILTTALQPDELLTEIIVPNVPGSVAAFEEISRRKGDFALAGIAARITLSDDVVSDVRLAACGVGSVAMRLASAEQVILRDGLNEAAIRAAATAAKEEIDPFGDLHASAAYRKRLVGILVARALGRLCDD